MAFKESHEDVHEAFVAEADFWDALDLLWDNPIPSIKEEKKRDLDFKSVICPKQSIELAPPSKTTMKPRSVMNRWTHEEEIILQGVVIDCNLAYGTEASWKIISRCYQMAVKRYAERNHLMLHPNRSSGALKKHYRIMHKKAKGEKLSSGFWYKVYHKCWLSEHFNAGNKLIDCENV